MLASVYTDDEERGNAIGIALGGLAMGVLGMYYFRLVRSWKLKLHKPTFEPENPKHFKQPYSNI